MVISDKAALALRDAVATRGAHKGKLKAKAPPARSNGYAAWQAAQMVCNPFKVSIFGQIMMSDEQRAIFEEVLNIFETLNIRGMDRDRNALERLGAW